MVREEKRVVREAIGKSGKTGKRGKTSVRVEER